MRHTFPGLRLNHMTSDHHTASSPKQMPMQELDETAALRQRSEAEPPQPKGASAE